MIGDYLSPGDGQCPLIPFNDDHLSNDHIDILQIHQSSINIGKNENIDNNLLIKLPSTTLQPQNDNNIKLKDIVKAFDNQNIFTQYFSTSGYDFSNEFNRVYRMKSTEKEHFYLDSLALCHRVLSITNPYLTSDVVEQYSKAIHILAYTHLEDSYTLSATSLQPSTTDKTTDITSSASNPGFVRIFIGSSYSSDINTWLPSMHFRITHLYSNIVANTTQTIFTNRRNNSDNILYKTLSEQSIFCCYHTYDFAQYPALHTLYSKISTENTLAAKDRSELSSYSHARVYLKMPIIIDQNAVVTDEDDSDATTTANSITSTHSIHTLTPPHDAVTDILTTYHMNTNAPTDSTSHSSTASSQRLYETACGSDLLVWGSDPYRTTGIGIAHKNAATNNNNNNNDSTHIDKSMYINMQSVPLPISICSQRVKLVACSSRHTLILTGKGQIYACGDNSEGALGVGDLLPRYACNSYMYTLCFLCLLYVFTCVVCCRQGFCPVLLTLSKGSEGEEHVEVIKIEAGVSQMQYLSFSTLV